MDTLERRQQQKEKIEKYRIAAARYSNQFLDDPDVVISIPLYGHIHPMEEGAFVDAVIWIPKEKL